MTATACRHAGCKLLILIGKFGRAPDIADFSETGMARLA
jgi:hypothetical protein